jgi:hypothetical protein
MALSEDTDDEDCYAHCKRATRRPGAISHSHEASASPIGRGASAIAIAGARNADVHARGGRASEGKLRHEACASASRDGSSCTGSPLGSDCRAAVAAEAMLRWNAGRRYLRRDGGIVSNLGPRPTFRAQGSPPQDQCERTCSQTCLMPCRPDGPRWKASASLK